MPSMDYRNIADRLTRTYSRITPAERAEGLTWYHRANDIVSELAADYGLSVDNVAAVMAVLSPNVRWAQNVRAARIMCSAWYHGEPQPPVPGYPANRSKAWAILQTGDTSHLKGPKVEAFAANLRGDLDYVTIDMWVMRSVGGDPERIPANVRHNVDLGYRRAAYRANMSPAEFQAVIWCHVRPQGGE